MDKAGIIIMTDFYELAKRYFKQRIELGENEIYLPANLRKPKKVLSEPITSEVIEEKITSTVSLSKDNIPQSVLFAPELSAEETAYRIELQKANTLEELYNMIKDCKRCPLHKTRTKTVFGDGNPQADVVFIGEAPGYNEDKQGKTFVGKAGALLTKIVEAIKFKREDIFICNILKCRPPNNRDPEPMEIKKCEAHLLRQLELIRPMIICTLGRFAAQTLLCSKAPMWKLRSEAHYYKDILLIPTYHPAALLRNPAYKRDTWEDVKFLRKKYDELKKKDIKK